MESEHIADISGTYAVRVCCLEGKRNNIRAVRNAIDLMRHAHKEVIGIRKGGVRSFSLRECYGYVYVDYKNSTSSAG